MEDFEKSSTSKDTDSIVIASTSIDKDSSLLDFKSPKQKPNKITLLNFKPIKSKKKQYKSKSKLKGGTKTVASKHETLVTNSMQMMIGSNFLKSANEIESKTLPKSIAYVCPVCFKNFKDTDSRTLHMKTCAAKNNISSKKLIDALKLQERQTAERISLGLLAAPSLPGKKPLASCKMASNDSQLQLALALSKSLYEAEEQTEFKEIEELSKIYSADIPLEQPKLMLQYSKSNTESTANKMKKRHVGKTILQTRSQEERNNILAERIAEVLTGKDEQLNQRQDFQKDDTVFNLKRQILREYLHPENILWNTSTLMPSYKSFYVSDLSIHITPIEKEIESLQLLPSASNLQEIHKSSLAQDELQSKVEEKSDILAENKVEQERTDSTVNNLITDWVNALNDSSASDLIIFVSEEKHIWAHKLVFYVRCSDILLDITVNNNTNYSVKEAVHWNEVDYHVALAFLEFIYCGTIQKYSDAIFNSKISMSRLGQLARRYKMKTLFLFLRKQRIINNNIPAISHSSYQDSSQNGKTDLPNETNVTLKNVAVQVDESLMFEIRCEEKSKSKFDCGHSQHFNSSHSSMEGDNKMDLRMLEVRRTEITPTKRNWLSSNCLAIDEFRNLGNGLSPDMFDDIGDVISSVRESDRYVNCKSSKLSEKFDQYANKSPISKILETTNIEFLNENVLSESLQSNTDLASFTQRRTNMRNVKSQSQPSPSRRENTNNNICIDLSNSTKIFTQSTRKSMSMSISETTSPISNSSKLERTRCTSSNKKKQRSNFSLYIEQIRNENAQLELDSEFEVDSPVKVCVKGSRNVFSKKQIDDSSVLNDFDGDTGSTLSKEELKKEVGRLTMFERDIKIDAAKHPELYNITTDGLLENKLGGDFDVRDGCVDESFEMTLRTDESFEFREKKIIKRCEEEEVEFDEQIVTGGNNKSENVIKNNVSNALPSLNNDSNFGMEDEVSMYTKYRRNHKDNSIAVYRSFIKTHQSNEIGEKVENEEEIEFASVFDEVSIQQNENDVKKKDTIRENTMNNKKLSPRIESSFNFEVFNDSLQETDSLNKEDNSKSNLKYSFNESLDTIVISSSPENDANNIDTDVFVKDNSNVSIRSNVPEFEEKLEDFYKSMYDDNGNSDSIFVGSSASVVSEISTKPNILKAKSKSMENLQLGCTSTCNYEMERAATMPIRGCDKNCENRKLIKKAFTITEFDGTSLSEYDNMSTSELEWQIWKYGLKGQKRKRAIKLLSYIYNELHPTISVLEKEQLSVSQDDGPPEKKRKEDIGLLYEYYTPSSQMSESSISQKMLSTNLGEQNFDDIENIISLKDCTTVHEAFIKLIEFHKSLHNKILRYEPLNVEELFLMLKRGGFKCKNNDLLDFLDEQCITFHIPESNTKSRRRAYPR